MLESSEIMEVRFASTLKELDNSRWMLIDVERTGENEDQKIRFIFLDDDVITSWYHHDNANVFYSIEYNDYAEIKGRSNVNNMDARGPSGVV